MTDLLVRDSRLGRALAALSLGDKPVALMRGHGNVTVGSSIPFAVYHAIYTEVNARLQLQAISLGGSVSYIAPEEGKLYEPNIAGTISRPWELWKKRSSGNSLTRRRSCFKPATANVLNSPPVMQVRCAQPSRPPRRLFDASERVVSAH